jgi:hypothetical protein
MEIGSYFINKNKKKQEKNKKQQKKKEPAPMYKHTIQ